MANKFDIEHSIIEMQGKRQRLGLRKSELQRQISEKKEMLKFIQQGHETFEQVVQQKKELVADLNDVELEIMRTKQELKKRQTLKDELTQDESPKAKKWEAEITALRDYYLEFTKDKTRVSSLRIMAAEMADKLGKVIKALR